MTSLESTEIFREVLFVIGTLYSHTVCIHPGVQMGTAELLKQPPKLFRLHVVTWTSISHQWEKRHS